MLYVLQTYPETIADGEGIRFAIYLSGCNHYCKGCHNPESWNPTAGTLLTDEMMTDIIQQINRNPLLDGVTFSGGDPFFNPTDFLYFIRRVKEETHQSIWCYTGYTLEELEEDSIRRIILPYIDVLIDGKYIEEQYSPFISFRGSTNQRILKLKEGKKVQELNI